MSTDYNAVEQLENIDRVSNPQFKDDDDKIKALSDIMGMDNVAEEILNDDGGHAFLIDLADQVDEDYKIDRGTMNDWIKWNDEGIKLNRFDMSPRSDPWPGSANFKSTRGIAVSLQFSDRANSELLTGTKIVKSVVFGDDKEGEKKERAERNNTFLNWQVLKNMPGWKENHRKMLYSLPNLGVCFKKTFYNSLTGKCESRMIPYGQYVVNNETTIEGELHRFSEKYEYRKTEIIQRQNSGEWLSYDDESGGDYQGWEKEHSRVIEQYTWADLDGDGIEEPYAITQQKETKKIFHILPLFNSRTVWVAGDNPKERITLKQLQELKRQAIKAQQVDELSKPKDIYKDYKVVYIEPIHGITKYGYIPDPNGGYLDVGNYYMMASLIGSINKTVNQVTNTTELVNQGGGILSDVWDRESGEIELLASEWTRTSIPPSQLQGSMLPWPIREPSPMSIELVRLQIEEIEFLSSSQDLSKFASSNTAATVFLAMIMKQESAHGSIIDGVYTSMSREFSLIRDCSLEIISDVKYREVVDDDKADKETDLTDELLDIYPTANPEASSKTQRIQLAATELTLIDNYIQRQEWGKVDIILKNFLESIGSTITEQMYPTLTPQQIEEQQEQSAQQQAEAKAKEDAQLKSGLDAQDSLTELNRSSALLNEFKAIELDEKTDPAIKKIYAEIKKLLADADKSFTEANRPQEVT